MEQRKKSKAKSVISAILILAVAAFLVALPFIMEKKSENSGSEASILSTKAAKADIAKTVSGTGTLTSQDAQAVNLPAMLEITNYLVSNGDAVIKGQALATVDRVTAMQAISALKETLEYVEGEMETASSEKGATVISSPAEGTILKVYAQQGDDVRSVVMKYGCLAVLDIAGKEWKAQAYTGTVMFTYAEEGKAAYEGSTLFTLQDTGDSSKYAVLTQQHREYEEIMQRLFAIYRDGVLTAPCDGLVSGIDEDAAAKLAAAAGKSAVQAETVADVQEDSPYVTATVKEDPALGIYISIMLEGQDTDITDIIDWQYITADKKEALKKGDQLTLFKVTDAETGAVTGYIALAITEQTDPVSPVGPGGGGGTGGGGMGGGGTGGGGVSFGGGGGMSFGGSSAYSSADEFEMYSTAEETVMSVTPQETVSVSITVDELDILSVVLGQEASVTLDALPGKSYSGTVTDINTSASNSGGNSKYSAVITLDKGENMLPGMNASTLITVSTTEGVLTVPSEAVTEEKGRTVVYTGYDEAEKKLTGPVEITTGVSDGVSIQVISGLKEGQTVYYEYYDKLEIEDMFGQMPGGMGGGGSLLGRLTGGMGRRR